MLQHPEVAEVDRFIVCGSEQQSIAVVQTGCYHDIYYMFRYWLIQVTVYKSHVVQMQRASTHRTCHLHVQVFLKMDT